MGDQTTPLNDSMQVLILDDERAVTAAVARQLQDVSAHLHCCTDIPAAEAICATQQIDVALIDHHLGGGTETGLDFLTRLGGDHPHCFRVLFTAEADFDFVVDAINRGSVDGFLPKPWNDEQLRVLVRQGAQTAWLRQHNALLHEHLTEQNDQLNRFNAQLESLVLERTGTLERMNRQLTETNRQLGSANQELSSYQQELVAVETQTAISQMVQGLAHELNNPLAVILGYAQRYQRRYQDDAQLHKCFRIIREEGERARTLISQLRRFAVREGADPESCSLEEVFAAASRRLQERRGRLLPCYLHGEDRQVLTGRRSLVQAIEQIIENANENPETTRIDVTCTEHRGRLQLLIDNDGQPPDDEALHKAVKPFYTGKGIDHPGLGLSLASSLLGNQGCSLSLATGPEGQGARVSIVFPPAGHWEAAVGSESSQTRPVLAAFTPTDAPAPTDGPLAAEADPAASPAAGKRVLVVDDEALVLDLIGDTCSDCGLAVDTATSLAAARTLAGRRMPDYLIVDAHIDDGDVCSFVEDLIATQADLGRRMLLITGDPHAPRAEQIVERFACPVLGKPFRIGELVAALDAWLA